MSPRGNRDSILAAHRCLHQLQALNRNLRLEIISSAGTTYAVGTVYTKRENIRYTIDRRS